MKQRTRSFPVLRTLFLTCLLLAVLACAATPLGVQEFINTQMAPVKTPASPTPGLAAGGLAEIPLQAGFAARGPYYEIYFSDPFNPEAAREEGGPDLPLVQAINAARISVDMAAYSFNLYSIQEALLRADKRGVQVRLVMESENIDNTSAQVLLTAGIPIVGDERDGLMHDKFVVIDRSEVWTGSMNFTTAGVYDDNNNLVRIRSSKAAEDYTVEFEEMFRDNFFGVDAIAQTPNPLVTIGDVGLEIYFSPDDHAATRIATLLRQARKSILFMAYSFTVDDFGDILRQQAQAGLDVRGVMEEKQVEATEASEFNPFREAGLPVYMDGNSGEMHHKVIIIDQRIVITGSYNFSVAAEETNDENVVVFFDPRIAAQYLAEFQRVFDVAQR